VRKTILALAAVACIAPVLAFAVEPRPDSQFTYCKSRSDCPLSFVTNATSTKIRKLTIYSKCSDAPVGRNGHFPRVPVDDEGEFSKKGTIDNVIGDEIEYEIEGRFRKRRKAVGTYRLTSLGCTDSKREFVATRSGEAP
jgi:hypothetical protein